MPEFKPATAEEYKIQIKQLFKNLVSISEPDWVAFSGKLHFKRFNKKSRISLPGRVEDRLYFLADGVVRFIVIHPKREIPATAGIGVNTLK